MSKKVLSMLKNYFFDFDKTLADTGNVSIIATQKAFLAFGLVPPAREKILDLMGIPAEISVPQMTNKKLAEEEIEKICTEFRTIYKVIEFNNTSLYPGIGDLLTSLYKSKKRLFVVSSKAVAPLNRNLEALGILDYFEEIIGCDMVEHYKPAPDGINLLVEKYNLNKQDSVMIGDARYDLQMGKNANVKTIGAEWGAFDVKSLVNENPTYLAKEPLDILNFD